MNLNNLEESQVEFIINCIEKASIRTTEQQELLAWISLQYIHQKRGDEFKQVTEQLGFTF